MTAKETKIIATGIKDSYKTTITFWGENGELMFANVVTEAPKELGEEWDKDIFMLLFDPYLGGPIPSGYYDIGSVIRIETIIGMFFGWDDVHKGKVSVQYIGCEPTADDDEDDDDDLFDKGEIQY